MEVVVSNENFSCMRIIHHGIWTLLKSVNIDTANKFWTVTPFDFYELKSPENSIHRRLFPFFCNELVDNYTAICFVAIPFNHTHSLNSLQRKFHRNSTVNVNVFFFWLLQWPKMWEHLKYQSSPIDWCEGNYQVSANIAEFVNTVSFNTKLDF